MAEADEVSYICRERSTDIVLQAAKRLFGRFHRFPPSRVLTGRCDRRVPRVLVRLGELKALVYSSDRGKPGQPRSFIHFMDSPPTLACDAAGRRLFILGGRFRVTPFGIEG
jgi:hypothetical protein